MPQGTISSISSSPFAKFEEDGSKQAQLIDVATGDFVLSKRAGLTSRMDCSHGEGGTVVLCASKQDGALAVDKAGKILWRRAAGDGPGDWNATAEADFKDLFYAKDKDGTFVVDGRTGRTVSADAGIVPEHVNAYAALVYTDTGTEVHHAER
jgi:hypothetical protein